MTRNSSPRRFEQGEIALDCAPFVALLRGAQGLRRIEPEFVYTVVQQLPFGIALQERERLDAAAKPRTPARQSGVTFAPAALERFRRETRVPPDQPNEFRHVGSYSLSLMQLSNLKV